MPHSIKSFFSKILKFLIDSFIGNVILVTIFINYFWQFSIVPSASMENTLKVGDVVVVNKHTFGLKTLRIPVFEYNFFTDKNNFILEFNKPHYSQITVFHPPFSDRQYYVKRMLAKPGDTIFFKNKKLYINFNENNYDEAKNKLKLTDASESITIDGQRFFIEPYRITIPGIRHEDKIKFIKNDIADNSLISNINLDSLSPDLRTNLENYQTLSTISEFPNHTKYISSTIIVEGEKHSIYRIPENKYFMSGDNRDNSKDSRFFGPVDYQRLVGTPSFILFNFSTLELNRFFKGSN